MLSSDSSAICTSINLNSAAKVVKVRHICK
nr:MAG TPA: hypothetical protein [Bacteriophage sp.]